MMFRKHFLIILNALFFALLALWHFYARDWRFQLDDGTGLIWLFYIWVNTLIFVVKYDCVNNVEEFESPKWIIIQTVQFGLLPVMYGVSLWNSPLFFLISVAVGVAFIRDCPIFIIFGNHYADDWQAWKARRAERLHRKRNKRKK